MPNISSSLTSVATQEALPPGEKLKKSRYEIFEILGHGSFGITYLARDSSLQAEVTIKEYLPWGYSAYRDREGNVHLHSGERNFKQGLESFLKEIHTLAKINHPNIVKVDDFFRANDTGYLVTAYEPGENLADFLAHHRHLQEKKLLEIIFPLLVYLGVVHMEGILHGNIKPSNIIVRPDGRPGLLGFGAAQEVVSKYQLSPSSMNYPPPERFDKQGKQGPWTDIYALGAICYRIISGQHPPSALKRLEAVQSSQPDPLQSAQEVGKGRYRREILKAIDCALRLDQAQRPQNTLEWRQGMVMPNGSQTQISERKTGRFLSKLRHMFRPADQDAPRSTLKAESEPTLQEATASISATPATGSHSEPSYGKESMSAEGVDYSPDERAEWSSRSEDGVVRSKDEAATVPNSGEASRPPSLTGVAGGSLTEDDKAAASPPPASAKTASLPKTRSPPSKADRTAASPGGRHSKPKSVPKAAKPGSATAEQTPPTVGGLPRPAAAKPAAALPKPHSTKPSKRVRSGAPRHGVQASAGSQAEVRTPEVRMDSPAKSKDVSDTLFDSGQHTSAGQSVGNRQAVEPRETPPHEDGLDKLFESSRQPSAAHSAGTQESAPHPETPPHQKDWSSLFEVQERPRPARDFFSVTQPGVDESPVKQPADEPRASAEVPMSPITAYKDRALKLFRNHDYAGALAELEAALALEPENQMLLANIKRVKKQLQGPAEPEGNPWATS